MQTMIIYQEADGLVVACGMGPDGTLDNHTPESGLVYLLGVSGQLGQYYDAATGLVSDTAPMATTPVAPVSPVS